MTWHASGVARSWPGGSEQNLQGCHSETDYSLVMSDFERRLEETWGAKMDLPFIRGGILERATMPGETVTFNLERTCLPVRQGC